MSRKTLIGFTIEAEFFLAGFPEYAYKLVILLIEPKTSFQPETLGTKPHIALVGFAKIAPGKTEIVYGVQQIGFANAIRSAQSHDPF
jgi:hypothetical protein